MIREIIRRLLPVLRLLLLSSKSQPHILLNSRMMILRVQKSLCGSRVCDDAFCEVMMIPSLLFFFSFFSFPVYPYTLMNFSIEGFHVTCSMCIIFSFLVRFVISWADYW